MIKNQQNYQPSYDGGYDKSFFRHKIECGKPTSYVSKCDDIGDIKMIFGIHNFCLHSNDYSKYWINNEVEKINLNE
ncbi:MAG: hypothetical protein P8Y49_02825 [Sulfurovaceae bacterium]